MSGHRVIVGTELLEALKIRGLVPAQARRIVIDIEAEKPAMLYFECFGDERLFEVFSRLTVVENEPEGGKTD
jgi:hypothetical protein